MLVNEALGLAARAAFALLVARLYDDLTPPQRAHRWGEWSHTGARENGVLATNARAFAAVAVAGVAATWLATTLVDGVRMRSQVAVIAHRGAAALAPENTLAAVDRAIADGADWIEIDVLESADGEVVVVHDRDLKRVGGVAMEIADTTAEELRAIDVGAWFAPEFAGERVPLLAEVLERARGRAGVVIELKHFGRAVRLEEKVVEIVESLGVSDQIVAMSLDRASVERLQALRPQWRVGLITAIAIGNLAAVDVDFFAVNEIVATPAFIRAAHTADREVYVWPIYDTVQKARTISLGADGYHHLRPSRRTAGDRHVRRAQHHRTAARRPGAVDRYRAAGAGGNGWDRRSPPAGGQSSPGNGLQTL